MFIMATATALLLSDVLALLADVIGLPPAYAMAIFASPALVIGAGLWWGAVERRGSYSYLIGGLVGSVTALLTGLLWTTRFVVVWGTEMLAVDAVSLLVGAVLGVVVLAGAFTGLPLMYARRRLESGPSSGAFRAG